MATSGGLFERLFACFSPSKSKYDISDIEVDIERELSATHYNEHPRSGVPPTRSVSARTAATFRNSMASTGTETSDDLRSLEDAAEPSAAAMVAGAGNGQAAAAPPAALLPQRRVSFGQARTSLLNFPAHAQPPHPAFPGVAPLQLPTNHAAQDVRQLSWLGQGAGGVVYKGLWQSVQVAVKFMVAATPDKLSDIAKEATVSKTVSHPNVVQTFAYHVERVTEESLSPSTSAAMLITPSGPSAVFLKGIAEVGFLDMRERLIAQRRRESASDLVAGANSNSNNNGVSHSNHSGGGGGGGGGSPSVSIHNSAGGGGGGGSAACAPSPRMEDIERSMGSFASGDGFGDPEMRDRDELAMHLADVLRSLSAMPGQYLTYIIMEYCDRGSLQAAISKGMFKVDGKWGNHLPLRALLRTAREIAQGMHHLHTINIIHGDLKPGNVLLTSSRADRRGFIAKVSDFGLATIASPGEEVQGGYGGTYTHMAPEVIDGNKMKASDVYSYGVVLWQMCTGQAPFAGLAPHQIMYGVQAGDLELDWPEDKVIKPLIKLGKACLMADPTKRPTFSSIAKALVKIETYVRNQKRLAQSSALTLSPPESSSAGGNNNGGGGGGSRPSFSSSPAVALFGGGGGGGVLSPPAAAAAAAAGGGSGDSPTPSATSPTSPAPPPGGHGGGPRAQWSHSLQPRPVTSPDASMASLQLSLSVTEVSTVKRIGSETASEATSRPGSTAGTAGGGPLSPRSPNGGGSSAAAAASANIILAPETLQLPQMPAAPRLSLNA